MKQIRIAPAAERATEQALATCQRLGLKNAEQSFYMTVFTSVREAEVAGRDTYSLWQQYRNCSAADLATAAYIEAVASTRRMPRAHA